MKPYPYILAIAVILLASCQSTNISPKSQPDAIQATPVQKVVTLDKNFKIASGQTVYVPVYSHIYHHNKQEIFELAVTLSIRNTDLTNPIVITSVRYYNSEGKMNYPWLTLFEPGVSTSPSIA
jgi:Protein of unknown function (DUF3124)